MTTVLSVANQKGGVGKTTTTVNLAASLATTQRKVLVIDMDPQGNATMGSGYDKHVTSNTVCEVLLGEASIADSTFHLDDWDYDLIPSNSDLTVAEVKLMTMIGREFKLRDALAKTHSKYDYVLIDCPPALNMLTVNAMVASQGVIIPMQCEYYALEGLSDLMQTIEDIQNSVNSELKIAGILRTMFDPRNNLSSDVSDQLVNHFGEQLYNTIIPRNVRLAEAPSHGTPILHYDRDSRGALAYLALAGEMLRRTTSSQLST